MSQHPSPRVTRGILAVALTAASLVPGAVGASDERLSGTVLAIDVRP